FLLPFYDVVSQNMGIQWTGWAISGALETENFYDLAGSGTFILLDGKDRRFNNVRDSPRTIFVYWNLSGCLTLLPTLMLNIEQLDEPLSLRDYLGWGICCLGFATEAITDQQKWLFKGNPDNAGKFIQSGLWGYSRHPNYLTEILQWVPSMPSPLFVWFLLCHISGIPILDKQAMKKWGSDPAFQDYVKNTPLSYWPIV
uniref:Si:ch211-210c8.6 n=1 Tax=Hucho hucho TaxID=62062 RepID=A0A4W5LW29_9TELE